MNNNILNYIFKNTKNIIDNTKYIFKNIDISEKEKYDLYPFLYNNLNNIYDIILEKKTFIKKKGLLLDDNFYTVFYDIINNLKKDKLYMGGNKNLIDYIGVLDPDSKKILKFNSINKKISDFFKTLEKIFNEKMNIFFSNNIIINENNKKNYFIKYFIRLLKRYSNENNNNIINLQNNQQNYFDKTFSNYLNKYIISTSKDYNINKLIKSIESFLIFLDKNNLKDIKIVIYLKIISEIFLAKNIEPKIIYYIIIILGIIIIKDYFIFLKNKNKLSKKVILILFILLVFIISLINL
jgi:hypothetical protein